MEISSHTAKLSPLINSHTQTLQSRLHYSHKAVSKLFWQKVKVKMINLSYLEYLVHFQFEWISEAAPRHWNKLLREVVDSATLDSFKGAELSHLNYILTLKGWTKPSFRSLPTWHYMTLWILGLYYKWPLSLWLSRDLVSTQLRWQLPHYSCTFERILEDHGNIWLEAFSFKPLSALHTATALQSFHTTKQPLVWLATTTPIAHSAKNQPCTHIVVLRDCGMQHALSCRASLWCLTATQHGKYIESTLK